VVLDPPTSGGPPRSKSPLARSTVQTATGPVSASSLGFVLMHEHVAKMWPAMRIPYPMLFESESIVASAVRRLMEAVRVGVKTVVDLTPIDLGRDVGVIQEVAVRSGLQIVIATGFYYPPPFFFLLRPTADIQEFMVREILIGVGATRVKAGVIKCASEYEPDRMNIRVLRAAARAQRATGVPIYTHSNPRARNGLTQAQIFLSEGVDLDRVVIGHCDDTSDIDYLEQVLASGVNIGFDRFGLAEPTTTAQRTETLLELLKRGYADRIVLSHDAAGFDDMARPGALQAAIPEWRFDFLAGTIVPSLEEQGVSSHQIALMTEYNPRRILSPATPYSQPS
jgi:phosphotriesterase-related protein